MSHPDQSEVTQSTPSQGCIIHFCSAVGFSSVQFPSPRTVTRPLIFWRHTTCLVCLPSSHSLSHGFQCPTNQSGQGASSLHFWNSSGFGPNKSKHSLSGTMDAMPLAMTFWQVTSRDLTPPLPHLLEQSPQGPATHCAGQGSWLQDWFVGGFRPSSHKLLSTTSNSSLDLHVTLRV